ncbi:MAG: N4-gp56 family major capsid protein [Clostridiaceae bacterium]|nr:N4-gp56 family major capsid protein [Clostridiaceae bacterium]
MNKIKNLKAIQMIALMFSMQLFAADYHGTGGMVDADAGTTSAYTPGTAENRYNDTEGLSVEMKEYYTEKLIRKQGPKLIHEQFGVSKPIPARKGDRAEFRYRKSLPKALTPLTEGVTPSPDKMTIVPLYAEVNQYGKWLGYTDKLSLTAIDPMVSEMTIALSEQSALTCDTVVREVINGGYNVRFAPKNAGTASETKVDSRAEIDDTCLITVKDVFKMATILRAMNAPTKDGMFVAIAHPHVIFDLMMSAPDNAWRNVMSYAKPENMLKGEVGEIGGVRFVQTSEAKIFKGKIAGKYDKLTVASVSGATVTVKESLAADDDIDYINLNSKRYKVTGINASAKTLTLESAPEGAKADDAIYSGDTGANGAPVYSTLFIAGSEAYGVVDLGGNGVEFIAKPLGASGNDQLNQRGSVGWKTYKGAVILHEEYLLRYESGSTMSSEIQQGN